MWESASVCCKSEVGIHTAGCIVLSALLVTCGDNVVLANVLGPSDYPAGCPLDKRPCPSYCPVNDTCSEVVGLPCGTCHYIDTKTYEAHGFGIGSSIGIMAVLNDLGGSSNAASGRGVEESLVALNYNGTIDNSDTSPNTSAYSFNPDAKSPQ